MKYRLPLRTVLLVGFLVAAVRIVTSTNESKPNIVIILADDLGYGDLGCYGSPGIRTPELDRMAAQGLRFTDFYAGGSLCTPSRAAMLTGRLAIRSGVPYSNDMDRVSRDVKPVPTLMSKDPGFHDFNISQIRGTEIIERPADQSNLTRRYTEEAVRFIQSNHERPFFLYVAHTFPHTPLFASAAFKEKSLRGRYGDAVEELDWSVGRVLEALRLVGLDRNTLVFFTSDNGPMLNRNHSARHQKWYRAGRRARSSASHRGRSAALRFFAFSALLRGKELVGSSRWELSRKDHKDRKERNVGHPPTR